MSREQDKLLERKLRIVRMILGVCATAVPVDLLANDVFVSRGEFGEPSFSDVASPGALLLHLHTPVASEADRLSVRAQTQETLAVAEALEAARREREGERAARRRDAERERVEPVIYPRAPEHGVALWPARYYPWSLGQQGLRRPHRSRMEPAGVAPRAHPRTAQRWLAPRQP